MDATESPFAVLTFIAAPALLTNASSLLAMSTTNRMLRTRERMQDLYAKSETTPPQSPPGAQLVEQVNRVENQALMLLSALRCVYVALGAFAAATLVTLIGAGLTPEGEIWFQLSAAMGLVLGFIGVGGLVLGTVHLFHATQLSLISLREEARLIRQRQDGAAASRPLDSPK
jgi:hypothetical protein